MKNISLYGRFIIILVASSFVGITFFCDYAKAENAMMKLYVWDFGTREGTKNTLTKNLTQEFGEALIQKKCSIVLERRNYDRLRSQKESEKAIMAIEGISQENLDKLKLLHADAVVFGEVYDDSDSGEIKITATVQAFNGVKMTAESIRFSRKKSRDATTREENMQRLVEKLCASLVPASDAASDESASQVIIVVEDLIGLEQPQSEVTQTIVKNLNSVSAVFEYDNVHVGKLGYRIPATRPIEDIALKTKTSASFKLTEQSFNALKNENILDDILEKLRSLENQEFTGEKDFLNAVTKYIGKEQTVRYEPVILKHVETSYNNANSIGIFIGGRYEQTPQGGILHVHLRIVNLPTFIPGFIQNFHFSFQPHHPSEIGYFSYFIGGVSRLVVKDWKWSVRHFSKSLDQLSNSIKQEARFKLIELSLENLRKEGIPDKTLEGLKLLENQEFTNETEFLNAVEKQIGKKHTVRYKELILKHANQDIESTIYALRGMAHIGRGEMDSGYDDFDRAYNDPGWFPGLGSILICVSIIIIIIIAVRVIWPRVGVIWPRRKKAKGKLQVIVDPKTETLKHALGIETLDLRWRGKTFSIILEKDSKINQPHTEIFTTARDYQTVAEIHVLQGLHDTRSVGKLFLKGIPPAPQGVPQISVTFNINSKGILQVQAMDLGTGQTIEHEFKISSGL